MKKTLTELSIKDTARKRPLDEVFNAKTSLSSSRVFSCTNVNIFLKLNYKTNFCLFLICFQNKDLALAGRYLTLSLSDSDRLLSQAARSALSYQTRPIQSFFYPRSNTCSRQTSPPHALAHSQSSTPCSH
jgi:hypothetical protein